VTTQVTAVDLYLDCQSHTSAGTNVTCPYVLAYYIELLGKRALLFFPLQTAAVNQTTHNAHCTADTPDALAHCTAHDAF
jgi:hypothetical protein